MGVGAEMPEDEGNLLLNIPAVDEVVLAVLGSKSFSQLNNFATVLHILGQQRPHITGIFILDSGQGVEEGGDVVLDGLVLLQQLWLYQHGSQFKYYG